MNAGELRVIRFAATWALFNQHRPVGFNVYREESLASNLENKEHGVGSLSSPFSSCPPKSR